MTSKEGEDLLIGEVLGDSAPLERGNLETLLRHDAVLATLRKIGASRRPLKAEIYEGAFIAIEMDGTLHFGQDSLWHRQYPVDAGMFALDVAVKEDREVIDRLREHHTFNPVHWVGPKGEPIYVDSRVPEGEWGEAIADWDDYSAEEDPEEDPEEEEE
jgi:hypothetical protein